MTMREWTVHVTASASPSPRGALAESRGGLAEADAVTCTVHWRPQWLRAGRGVDEEKEGKEEQELHRC